MGEPPPGWKILGPIHDIVVIGRGGNIRILEYLKGRFGGRNWRKMKGVARIEDEHGWIGNAEIHWFEAHGVGRVEWKIKKKCGPD